MKGNLIEPDAYSDFLTKVLEEHPGGLARVCRITSTSTGITFTRM